MKKLIFVWILCIGTMMSQFSPHANACEPGKRDVQAALSIYEEQTPPDYSQVIRLLKRAKEHCPTWSVPSRYIGDILAEQKKYPDAIDAYHEAIKINASDFEAYLYLGDAYNAENQPVHALRFYHKGMKILQSDIRLKAEYLDLLNEYQKKCSDLSTRHTYRDETQLVNYLDARSAKRLGVRPVIDTYIEFDTGQASTRNDWKAQLDTVAEVLKNKVMQNYRVIIQGHTDIRGNVYRNHLLSEKRARAVRRYLMRKGVPSSSILKAEGKGESQPLPREPGETNAEWHRRNRRVVFISCDRNETEEACLRMAEGN